MNPQYQNQSQTNGQVPIQQMPNQQGINQQPISQSLNQTPTIKDSPVATQSTLLISELRDSLVIMKDGSFRAVVACKSINFDLMSNAEREGVEYSYQNFLEIKKIIIFQ